MANEITVIYPYENSTQETVASDFVKALSDMPMFAQAYYDDDPSIYVANYGLAAFGWRPLESGYQHSVPYYINLVHPYAYYMRFKFRIQTSLPSTDRQIDFGNSNGIFYNSYDYTVAWGFRIETMRTIMMYKAKTENVNGFWQNYTGNADGYILKFFVAKCINEDPVTDPVTGVTEPSVEYIPVWSLNYGYNHSSNICITYPYAAYELYITNYKIANAPIGYSNAYVMRQLRHEKYLFPNIYIISGGLFHTDKDIITIDNNTYVHMCNDIYIRL